MAPSLWSEPGGRLAVCTGVSPDDVRGHLVQHGHEWMIEGDPEERRFSNQFAAAAALTGQDVEDLQDYLLAKGEESRTVFAAADTLQRITREGHWVLVTASAPTQNDVN